jgi:hypothetical protein
MKAEDKGCHNCNHHNMNHRVCDINTICHHGTEWESIPDPLAVFAQPEQPREQEQRIEELLQRCGIHQILLKGTVYEMIKVSDVLKYYNKSIEPKPDTSQVEESADEITEQEIISNAPYSGKKCNEHWIEGVKWAINKLLLKKYKLPEIKWNKATKDIPEGMADWNKLSIDDYCNYLERKHMFSSTGESKAIFEIIQVVRQSQPKREQGAEEIKNKVAKNNNFDSFDRAIRYTFNRELLPSEKEFIDKLFLEAMEDYANSRAKEISDDEICDAFPISIYENEIYRAAQFNKRKGAEWYREHLTDKKTK